MMPSVVRAPDRVDAAVERAEQQLRALHELRPEARLRPGFEPRYVGFLRALRERLSPRGVRNLRTLTLPGGLAFTVDLGDRLGCDVFYGYLEERLEADLFEAALANGGTMLDVGANFGYYAVRCARAAGPAGAVRAFEPDPVARDLLMQNAAVNGFAGRLHVHDLAVADDDGQVELVLAEEPAFSGLTSTERAAVRGSRGMTARSLDSFTAEHDIGHVDALKIDVEGHEADVLRGAHALLQRSPDPLVLLEVSAKNLTTAARDDLTTALGTLFEDGYCGLLPDLSDDSGLRQIEDAEEADAIMSANPLPLRPGGPVEQRIRDLVVQRQRAGTSANEASIVDGLSPLGDADLAAVRLFAGLDPDLVSAALRDKAEAQSRAETLTNETVALREEIRRLRAERAALRTEVARLSATPVGVAVRAARRLARSVAIRGIRAS